MPEPLPTPPPLTERDPLVPAVDDPTDPAPPPAFNRNADALRGPAPANALRDPIPPPRTAPSLGSGFRGFDPEPEAAATDDLVGQAAAWIRANREAALLGSFAVGVVIGVLLRR